MTQDLEYKGYTIWPLRELIGWSCQIERDGEIVEYTSDLDIDPAIEAAYRVIDQIVKSQEVTR